MSMLSRKALSAALALSMIAASCPAAIFAEERASEVTPEVVASTVEAAPAAEPAGTTENGLQYEISADRAFVTITGYTGPSTDVTVPAEIEGLPVTSIGNEAFYNCETLTNVILPDSITFIGDYAFRFCSNLVSITIPNSVTSIGMNVFQGCSSLTSATLSSGLTVIPGSTFGGCTSLTSITIPDSVTTIGSSAFSGCSSLASVTLSNRTASIERTAFSQCTNLTSITIPNSVTSIGQQAFWDCTSLTSITIPDSLTTIESSVFSGCSSLSSVTIPDSITSIKSYAFGDCTSLTHIAIPNSVTSIESRAFNGCTSLTNFTVPNSITAISWGAFAGCTSLIDFTIPDSITTIEGYAFDGCKNLTSIAIPESVTSVGPKAFDRCDKLTIYGKAGSYIETYAKENNIPFCTDTLTTGVSAFVERLYEVCLGRPSDAAGKADWVSRLQSGETTGTSAAYGFVFSQEFKNKNLCNTDFVKQLYLAFMGREADEGGLKDWVNRLESGTTREEVFNGFAMSTEFDKLCRNYGIRKGDPIAIPQYGTVPQGPCSVCGEVDGVTAFVTRLYNVCLDRKPDNNGLKDWTNQLWAHTKSGRDVSFGFIFSNEFKNKNYNDSDYVEYLYKAFFDRASDKAGKTDWLNRMSQGWTREQVFDGFVGSNEFDKLCKRYGIIRG